MLKRLYQYMRPYRFLFYLVVLLLFLELAASIVIPWVIGQIIDTVFKGAGSWELRRQGLFRLLAILIASFITLAVSMYTRGLTGESFGQKVIQRLRAALFNHMQKLDMSFYHRNSVGALMSRITSDVEQVRNYCAGGMMEMAFNVIFFPMALLYMLYLNWRLSLLCLVISPVIAVIAVRFSKIGKFNQRRNRKAYAQLSEVAQESLNGIRVIQNFMSQDYEIGRFHKKNRKLTRRRQRSLRNWTKYMPILEVLGSFCNILALTVGGYMAIRGDFSMGTWVQFTGYTWMIVAPMRQLGNLINMNNFARISAERLFDILDEPLRIKSPETTGPNHALPYVPERVLPEGIQSEEQLPASEAEPGYPQGRGELEFRRVSWMGEQGRELQGGSHAETPKPEAAEKSTGGNAQKPKSKQAILKDIDLKIPAGSSLGIIGETGSGKTSLADLICRFSDPDSGEILMDGVDLREWDVSALRSQISYVMQEPFLFSETLTYNISFNQPSIVQEKVIRSAQRSAAHGFIGMLQKGYQTVVGERGVGLSGGQRQRTALARALVKEAPILILDDTTSAVDMETEKQIQEQLKLIDSHHTRIIIAHRLSSVMDCDQIIVLKQGQIAERGTHQQLMQQKGYYCQVFTEQQILEEEDCG